MKLLLDKNQICEYQQNRDPYLMIDFASEIGTAYEKDRGPTGVNQLIEIPVADLILSESNELS